MHQRRYRQHFKPSLSPALPLSPNKILCLSLFWSLYLIATITIFAPTTTTKVLFVRAWGTRATTSIGRRSSPVLSLHHYRQKQHLQKSTQSTSTSGTTNRDLSFQKGRSYTTSYATSSSASSELTEEKPKKRNRKKKKMSDDEPTVPHVPTNLLPSWFLPERTKILTTGTTSPKSPSSEKNTNECVVYWMQRDVRTMDNWALLLAQHYAREYNVPLKVCYVLPPPPQTDEEEKEEGEDLPPKVTEMNMTSRHGEFLLGGLKFVQNKLSKKNVNLHILMPSSSSDSAIQTCLSNECQDALVVICDFNPLRQYRTWMEQVLPPKLDELHIPLYQVDAHNVVPVWSASPKREVGARTLRPKINKLLGKFMTVFPKFEGNTHLSSSSSKKVEIDWEECKSYLQLDNSVKPNPNITPGTKEAMNRYANFVSPPLGLSKFDLLRNDPNYNNVCSNLSPYVNYGHISFQSLALATRKLNKYTNGTASYLEEGIVRRELSDNYVYYTPDSYDELEGAAEWAQESLRLHESDEREYIYDLKEFEEGRTHDDLWNAAQIQLVTEGGMHGFLRMYWAKKILEWTPSPKIALRTAQYLNDRFALDGNDPNGFVGVGWSIMGIHDMGWKERPIFGKIRFMNYAGCKRKFKVDEFVAKYKGAKTSATAALAKHGNSASKKRSASSSSTSSTATSRLSKKMKTSAKKKK